VESGTVRYLELVDRPSDAPGPENFALAEAALPPVDRGQVLVENRYLSVDPYMRGRMSDRPSYYPPWPLRSPLDGDAVGVVVASRAPDLPEGKWVASQLGLRDRFVASPAALRRLHTPPAGLDHSCHLDALGGTGFTAYLGVEILQLGTGDCVFVTTAAGSVGSVAGQLCKLAGARVIGSTSTAEKARIAEERYGFDAVFEYPVDPPAETLARLAPEGLVGFFDNVGGEQLEAALDHMRIGGRIAKCGSIAGYNSAEPPPGPRNLHHFFGKRLTMIGFLVSDHGARRPEFERRMHHWLEAGAVRTDHRVFHGLEQIPEAFVDLFAGGNVGKTIVALDGGTPS
jgi:NADPH-dependent curcumin reductase CurA